MFLVAFYGIEMFIPLQLLFYYQFCKNKVKAINASIVDSQITTSDGNGTRNKSILPEYQYQDITQHLIPGTTSLDHIKVPQRPGSIEKKQRPGKAKGILRMDDDDDLDSQKPIEENEDFEEMDFGPRKASVMSPKAQKPVPKQKNELEVEEELILHNSNSIWQRGNMMVSHDITAEIHHMNPG